MNTVRKIATRYFLLLIGSFAITRSVHAQGGVNIGDCSRSNIDSFPFLEFFCRFGDLGALVSTLLPNVLLIAGLILLVYIIVAGFKTIQNAGSGEDTAQTRQALTAAVVGFFLIIASYFVVQLIQRITGLEAGF